MGVPGAARKMELRTHSEVPLALQGKEDPHLFSCEGRQQHSSRPFRRRVIDEVAGVSLSAAVALPDPREQNQLTQPSGDQLPEGNLEENLEGTEGHCMAAGLSSASPEVS